MSEIAEIRRIFQDLIAPDMKSIRTELKASETLAEARYQTVLAKLEVLEAKMKTAEVSNSARFDEIAKALDIEKRLERVEARQSTATN
jgi:uncharacterized protein YqgV (UPF0045/DUF77 family)